jgi:hypothetical protein
MQTALHHSMEPPVIFFDLGGVLIEKLAGGMGHAL